MTSLNPDLEREIDDFFEESNERQDNVFYELGFDPKQVCDDEIDVFLRERDKLLKNFEHHLISECSILKDLDENANLNDVLNEKFGKLINDEDESNKELDELLKKKYDLRQLLDVESDLVKESLEKKREVERMCNESIKEEFVRLCRFMNLKFQWNQTDRKFTIGKFDLILSDLILNGSDL